MLQWRPFIRRVRPFWLRERLFWKLRSRSPELDHAAFGEIELEFAPEVTLTLKPTDVGHQQIAYLGYMEKRLTLLMKSLASEGGLLVDVGANYGYFTCLWAAAGNSNRVIAFEASPRNLEALKHNVEKNGFQGVVTIVPNAAGREPGRMSFSLGPEEETGWGGLSLATGGNQTEVEVVTLSGYLGDSKAVPEIAVLKIDTEGADTWVLEGCDELLRAKRIRNIFFETNPDRMAQLGIDQNRAVNLLIRHGYQLERMGDDGWHAFVV